MKIEKNQIRLSTGIEVLGQDIQSEDEVPNRLLMITSKPIFDFGYELTFAVRQLEQMVENFNKGVLGRKVPVNFDHPRMRGAKTEAAGWIASLDIKMTDGGGIEVYSGIDWNKIGRAALFNKEYLYTSIGASLNFLDKKDGKTEHGMTLFELSLTNDPADVNLGEIAQYSTNARRLKEESEVDIKDTPEYKAVKEQVATLQAAIETQKKELSATLKDTQKELLSAKSELEKTQRSSTLDKMILENRITPAQKEKALTLSAEGFKGFEASVPEKGIVEAAPVKPQSGKNPPDGDKVSAEDKLVEMASKLQKENTISFSEAFSQVLRENKELAAEYNRSQK